MSTYTKAIEPCLFAPIINYASYEINPNLFYLHDTHDLVQWVKFHNPSTSIREETSAYVFSIDWNTADTNRANLRITYCGYSPNSYKKLYYKSTSVNQASNISTDNATGIVAGCYSPELRRAVFANADGSLVRIQDTSPTSYVVVSKIIKINETPPDCGITPNLGCLKWSPAASVFCVTGLNGVATSPTSDAGSWVKSTSAPDNLNGLEYREDIDGGSFIAWSATDKHIYTSKQGLSWTQYSTNPIPLDSIATVAYSPEYGCYCATAPQGNIAYFSKDLKEWTSTKISTREDLGVNGVIWMPSTQKFVLIPTDGYIFYTYSPEEAGYDKL